ncbi:uncharacterized protein DUF4397 [Thermolongibacillus altinsuensis]|uniref:Uncharacterized protein DUF4397 n=1 Tax=Thermolongibacillus altinsuensis TaxID=575256 RepID=A0A4R1QBV3_9BACL|nr:DUF4397 domain-containing protein [Thermolongibacillus altinsuensis]TCL46809.1 uncharacterized protein DUF4397 [Thermolongibacillus altinsuensis]GMB09258.1 hypothetical protein B1no1_19680 [Thermolongibacillus altinsuensis]
MKEIEKCVQKAVMYDLLARYYQYRDPNKYMMYYQKHDECMKKLVEAKQEEREEERREREARFRVFHASANTPAIDVYVNGQKILQNLKYKQISQYLKVPMGQHRIDVYPAGQSEPIILSETLQVLPGLVSTLTVVGDVHKLQMLPLWDQPYAPYGKAKVRFVHLSPDAPAVDVALKDGDVLFKNVSYRQAADYIEVPVNEKLSLDVRVAGTNNVALSVPNIRFYPNKSYTIAAVGYVSRTPSLEAILIEE